LFVSLASLRGAALLPSATGRADVHAVSSVYVDKLRVHVAVQADAGPMSAAVPPAAALRPSMPTKVPLAAAAASTASSTTPASSTRGAPARMETAEAMKQARAITQSIGQVKSMTNREVVLKLWGDYQRTGVPPNSLVASSVVAAYATAGCDHVALGLYKEFKARYDVSMQKRAMDALVVSVARLRDMVELMEIFRVVSCAAVATLPCVTPP
jgi:hypothetical protein